MKEVSGPAPIVLVIEDEPNIRGFLVAALASADCQAFDAGTAARGRIEAASRKPDLLIVDLGLPDGDGLSLIREIRSWSTVPILVLSARSSETDKVAALDLGADDYLTKPFGTAELLARVRALLRRAAKGPTEEAGPLVFGRLSVDLERRIVTRGGELVHLTPIEYKLLAQLVTNAGRVLTHRDLLARVWGPNHVEHTHYLRIYMAGLRRKLEDDPAFPAHIITESGVGYRLIL